MRFSQKLWKNCGKVIGEMAERIENSWNYDKMHRNSSFTRGKSERSSKLLKIKELDGKDE